MHTDYAHGVRPPDGFTLVESFTSYVGEQVAYLDLDPGRYYTAAYETMCRPSGEVVSVSYESFVPRIREGVLHPDVDYYMVGSPGCEVAELRTSIFVKNEDPSVFSADVVAAAELVTLLTAVVVVVVLIHAAAEGLRSLFLGGSKHGPDEVEGDVEHAGTGDPVRGVT